MANNQSLVLVEDGVVKGVSKGHRALVFRNGELTTVDGEGNETLAGASAAAVQVALSADPAGAREAMEAQSSARTFYDRFDDSSYYANGATITHAVSLPRVGAPWRLAVAADQIAPAVTIPPVSASSFQGEADDDSLTIAAGHSFLTKFPVRVTAGVGGLPAPLVENTTYYVIRISGTTPGDVRIRQGTLKMEVRQ